MKNLYFNDFEDLACDIADRFDRLDKENFEDIAVIAKPNEVKEIFKELVCIGYDICNITYERIDWDGYDDEYVLSMNHEGIWLEKFKRKNGYLNEEAPVIYVLDKCSSKVIPHCKGKTVYEVSVGDYGDEFERDFLAGICIDCCDCVDEDCPTKCKVGCKDDKKTDKAKKNEHVEYSKDKDGDLHGFTASKSDGNSYYSYSMYTSDKLSVRDIQSLLQEAGF